MRRLVYLGAILLLAMQLLKAQETALYNAGNIRIHEEGNIGFHTHLINDNAFDTNAGLAGFYGTELLSVSGAFMPVFFDTEIANANDLELQTSLGVTNNANFIAGNINTLRTQPNVFLNFFSDAFYTGTTDVAKVNGYVAVENAQNFTFPTGDAFQFRPLIINSEDINTVSRCAYFFEDPNVASSFDNSFNTDLKSNLLANISTTEFWKLEGSIPSTISLNWNDRSALSAFTGDINSIVVVGWSKTGRRWLSLGKTSIGGDISNGFISSDTFTPDNFEVITLGIEAVPTDVLLLDNYLVTPNGDGLNDVLIIPELEQSSDNNVQIYDRFGLKVFEQENYTNQFNGIPNVDNLVVDKEKGLPGGVYFYVIRLNDLQLNYQGFLYLTR